MNWHIEAMPYHLEQVRLGRIKRLIASKASAEKEPALPARSAIPQIRND
jgi:hypothetical protein